MVRLSRGYLLLLLVALASAAAMGWRYQNRVVNEGAKPMLLELVKLGWRVRGATPILGGTYVSYQLAHPRCDGVLQAMLVAPDSEAMSVTLAGSGMAQGVMFLGELHQRPPLLLYRFTQGWRKLWGLAPYPLYRVALLPACLGLIAPPMT
ncbi:hypothetical protein [Aeromonas sobria]|uniref:hypothetical protein n=1 Tax=Aeromonas sobria TaxID=646 RepID=UPI001874F71D|nr:hypothetical protein [Aeromonas sobria]